MHTNEKFLDAMQYMDSAIKADAKAGKPWTYCNVMRKKARDFGSARGTGNRKLNCVDGVQWALLMAGVPYNALAWYGGDGKIIWTNEKAKSAANKYFDIVPTNGKTIKQLYDSMLMCDGDISLGYQGFGHTNCYFGGTKFFDTGHANCSGSGEGARFKRFIGGMAYKNKKVNYILRLKDRAHYLVQCGAFQSEVKRTEYRAMILGRGFWTEPFEEGGLFKLRAGVFDGKTNAERMVTALSKKNIGAYIKEI